MQLTSFTILEQTSRWLTIMLLFHFTILGQENAKNISPYCTVKSYSHGPLIGRSLRFSDDAGCSERTRSRNNRKWQNSEIMNPLFDQGGEKKEYWAKHPCILHNKPFNKMCLPWAWTSNKIFFYPSLINLVILLEVRSGYFRSFVIYLLL